MMVKCLHMYLLYVAAEFEMFCWAEYAILPSDFTLNHNIG